MLRTLFYHYYVFNLFIFANLHQRTEFRIIESIYNPLSKSHFNFIIYRFAIKHEKSTKTYVKYKINK